MSDIQDYFEYLIKKHEKLTDNHPIRMWVKRIKIRITFKIKIIAKYYIEF